uniref:Secreted protein n=1 Tax=Panstrongylus lignarius TaxID=156445 RepID=A0A224XXH3_9HEMI
MLRNIILLLHFCGRWFTIGSAIVRSEIRNKTSISRRCVASVVRTVYILCNVTIEDLGGCTVRPSITISTFSS